MREKDDVTREDMRDEARAMRWSGLADEVVGGVLGDQEREARGRTERALASMRDYADKAGRTGERSNAMGEEDEDA